MHNTFSLQHRISYILLIAFFFNSCKKSGTIPDPAPAPVPRLSVENSSEVRLATATKLRFYLVLNKASDKEVKADFTLADASASSPVDYTAASGTVSFSPNQTSYTLEVDIKGDPSNLREENIYFTLQLNNPQNCTLASTSARGTIITENGTYLPTDNGGKTSAETYPGYSLAWSDEFAGTEINTANWNHETGNGVGGWGNNELEYYTSNNKNSFVSAGNLIIEARKESIAGFNYTSARMTTQNKRTFDKGRVDIRAKLPKGKGIWPALWMLGANISSVGWPACGEIDIMELVGHAPSTVHGTMHWKNAGGSNSNKSGSYNLVGEDFSSQFHVFSIAWDQDIIKWYVDDVLFLTNTIADVSPAAYPFNDDHFFIFNVAVGGNWPGSPDNNTVFPQRMFIDYIRVFQQ